MSNGPAGAGRQPRKRTLLVVLIAIIVIAAVVTVMLVAKRSDKTVTPPPRPTATKSVQPSPAPRTGLVTSFSGKGNETTKPFKVAANWEVRSRSQAGKAFAIELIGKAGASRGQIVTATKLPTGTTFVSEAGEFKLKVAAAGTWSIQIFSRPTSK